MAGLDPSSRSCSRCVVIHHFFLNWTNLNPDVPSVDLGWAGAFLVTHGQLEQLLCGNTQDGIRVWIQMVRVRGKKTSTKAAVIRVHRR
jgi:hypothetical protein